MVGGHDTAHLFTTMSVQKYSTAKGVRWRVLFATPDGTRTQKRGFLTKTAAKAWETKQASDILSRLLSTNTTTIDSGRLPTREERRENLCELPLRQLSIIIRQYSLTTL